MIWLLVALTGLCLYLYLVFVFSDIRVHVPTPMVSTARNQTIINSGEVVVTTADTGSVTVRDDGDVIVITYKRTRTS